MATYVGPDPDENRVALFATVDLFRRVAAGLAAGMGYACAGEVDEQLSADLRAIRDLGEHPVRRI